jgi:hypothetical protein
MCRVPLFARCNLQLIHMSAHKNAQMLFFYLGRLVSTGNKTTDYSVKRVKIYSHGVNLFHFVSRIFSTDQLSPLEPFDPNLGAYWPSYSIALAFRRTIYEAIRVSRKAQNQAPMKRISMVWRYTSQA